MKRPFLRYHGGKFRIAKWVITHFPPHRRYVELYGGGASVLFEKSISIEEVYNDLSSEIVSLFRVARDNAHKLKTMLDLTLWSREEFMLSFEPCDDPIEQARRTLVRLYLGFGTGGKNATQTGFNTSFHNHAMPDTWRWAEYPSVIDIVKERLKSVVIENRPALSLIDLYDGEETLFYLDPPYVPKTRIQGTRGYEHEMTEEDHIDLLEKVLTCKGMVIISGYNNDLYDSMLDGWEKQSINARAGGHRGAVKRKECIWINPNAQSKLQQSLFYTA